VPTALLAPLSERERKPPKGSNVKEGKVIKKGQKSMKAIAAK
jgi:hypothetical protein